MDFVTQNRKVCRAKRSEPVAQNFLAAKTQLRSRKQKAIFRQPENQRKHARGPVVSIWAESQRHWHSDRFASRLVVASGVSSSTHDSGLIK